MILLLEFQRYPNFEMLLSCFWIMVSKSKVIVTSRYCEYTKSAWLEPSPRDFFFWHTRTSIHSIQCKYCISRSWIFTFRHTKRNGTIALGRILIPWQKPVLVNYLIANTLRPIQEELLFYEGGRKWFRNHTMPFFKEFLN